MIRIETREQIKAMVNEYSEGISLTKLHQQVHRVITRLQLRTVLGSLYMQREITRERVVEMNRRITKYYPFNGKEPTKKTRKPKKEEDKQMLSMKDFMPGKKYQPFIEP